MNYKIKGFVFLMTPLVSVEEKHLDSPISEGSAKFQLKNGIIEKQFQMFQGYIDTTY